MHPLDGAYARLNRADIHISDLQTKEAGLIEICKDRLVLQHEPPSLNLRWRGGPDLIAENPDVSILIGETFYNLRAALDYLVYELARKDSGAEKNGTQFPICDQKRNFDGRRAQWLNGVNRAHVRAIEVFQPYKGCQWTKHLARISNPDKHRKLTLCQGMMEGWWDVRTGTPEELIALRANPVDPTPLPLGSEIPIKNGEQLEVYDHLTMYIAFDDGTPVMQTLKMLKSEITLVLDAFKTEF